MKKNESEFATTAADKEIRIPFFRFPMDFLSNQTELNKIEKRELRNGELRSRRG